MKNGGVIFITERGLVMDGKVVSQTARIEIWPWYKVLWHALRRDFYRYFVLYEPAGAETLMSDADAFKAFKEGQKGKHHPIWGGKDVEDAFYAGIERGIGRAHDAGIANSGGRISR